MTCTFCHFEKVFIQEASDLHRTKLFFYGTGAPKSESWKCIMKIKVKIKGKVSKQKFRWKSKEKYQISEVTVRGSAVVLDRLWFALCSPQEIHCDTIQCKTMCCNAKHTIPYNTLQWDAVLDISIFKCFTLQRPLATFLDPKVRTTMHRSESLVVQKEKWSGLVSGARARCHNSKYSWNLASRVQKGCLHFTKGRAAIYQIRNHMYHARRSLQADKSSAGAFNCGCKGVIDPAVRSGWFLVHHHHHHHHHHHIMFLS